MVWLNRDPAPSGRTKTVTASCGHPVEIDKYAGKPKVRWWETVGTCRACWLAEVEKDPKTVYGKKIREILGPGFTAVVGVWGKGERRVYINSYRDELKVEYHADGYARGIAELRNPKSLWFQVPDNRFLTNAKEEEVRERVRAVCAEIVENFAAELASGVSVKIWPYYTPEEWEQKKKDKAEAEERLRKGEV